MVATREPSWRETDEIVRDYTATVLGWSVFYLILFLSLRQVVRPRLPLTAEKRQSRVRLAVVDNTLVSLVNSVIQSVFSVGLWWWVVAGGEEEYERFEHYVPQFVCSFLGYNLYDLALGLLWEGGALFRSEPFLIVHHGVVISSLIGSMFNPYTMFYQVVATLCEVNSIFLHARSLILACQRSSGPFRHLRWPVAALQFLTFLSVRLPSSAWLVFAGLQYSIYVSGNYFWAVLAILLFIVNVVYLYRLLRSEYRAWLHRHHEKNDNKK